VTKLKGLRGEQRYVTEKRRRRQSLRSKKKKGLLHNFMGENKKETGLFPPPIGLGKASHGKTRWICIRWKR